MCSKALNMPSKDSDLPAHPHGQGIVWVGNDPNRLLADSDGRSLFWAVMQFC